MIPPSGDDDVDNNIRSFRDNGDSVLVRRVISSWTTFPNGVRGDVVRGGWIDVVGITLTATALAALVALSTGFVLPEDCRFVSAPSPTTTTTTTARRLFRFVKSAMWAFLFPCLLEETIWRGAMVPVPFSTSSVDDDAVTTGRQRRQGQVLTTAFAVLVAHVLSHPLAARLSWPRGRDAFDDPRFLSLAFVVLGGATASYLATGGSVWAAAFAHWLPLVLWRDVCGGERRLRRGGREAWGMAA